MCMERQGVQSKGDLMRYTEADLVSSKNFGRVSLTEIKNKLREMGLSLRS